LKFKIGLSLFFLAGFFFFRIITPFFVKYFKSGLQKVNPELAEKIPWFYKFIKVFFTLASVFCLIYIVLIWTNFVTIPEN